MARLGLLSGLLLHALCASHRPTLPRVALALVLTVLYAASDELHQSLVPNRMGRAQDVAIDTTRRHRRRRPRLADPSGPQAGWGSTGACSLSSPPGP